MQINDDKFLRNLEIERERAELERQKRSSYLKTRNLISKLIIDIKKMNLKGN